MRLSDVKKLVCEAGIPCYKWVVPDPENVPFPHACVAKIGSGNNLYADNGVYFPVARCQMYLAMYDDDRQEDIEYAVDKIFDDNNIPYTYIMGYNRDENIVVKTYTFEIPEEVTDNE
jgi:hypothetical protein